MEGYHYHVQCQSAFNLDIQNLFKFFTTYMLDIAAVYVWHVDELMVKNFCWWQDWSDCFHPMGQVP